MSLPVIYTADVKVPDAVRAHIDGAGYQIASLLPALRVDADRVMVSGDATVMAQLLPHGLPPCCAADSVVTFVVHITAAVGAIARTHGPGLVRKVLSAKAAAGPRDTVLVVLLANGVTGVMVAELELAQPPTPTDRPCNAPGGSA